MEDLRQDDITRAVEYGKLIESVNNLVKSVDDLTVDVIDLKAKLNQGRGVVMGLFLAGGAIGGSIGAFLHKAFEIVK